MRHTLTPEERKRGGLNHSHYFTHDQRVKGGKVRARNAASWRIFHPTPAEAQVRAAVALLVGDAQYEYPIQTQPGTYQYIDIYAVINGQPTAIEVDGSNGWHTSMSSKAAPYDELKARYCEEHGITLVYIPSTVAAQAPEAIVEHIQYQLSAHPIDDDIPF